ncbi:hypothetical protein EYF80_021790 [Liparis tanakae]|uniref:Uncharacterized protein n=1 Tax=Liparis tanakae TaxID=230148 RepID=A0A4Z2HQH3_9TELE|nr:hypothetical protein EYF80_021790 [Liparis tanakae]
MSVEPSARGSKVTPMHYEPAPVHIDIPADKLIPGFHTKTHPAHTETERTTTAQSLFGCLARHTLPLKPVPAVVCPRFIGVGGQLRAG